MEIIQILGGLASTIGALIYLIGWIWLMVIGFKKGGALWGILIFFFNWLAGLVFCFMNKTGWLQFAMMVIGAIISGIGFLAFIPMIMEAIENAQ